jgi:small subunit ribosomal protein S3
LGQKVHPLGFRLVTNQKHHSIWFAKFKNYPKLVAEDEIIRTILNKKSQIAGITKIEIERNNKLNNIKVILHSGKPSLIIGVAGKELKILYAKLKSNIKTSQNIILSILKIKNPYAEANLIGDFIVDQLEKRIAFKRAIKKAIISANLSKIPGIKIQISGRLNGADMARSEWVREGRVPLQTLRADIDYAEKQAKTIYGTVGIKVWLFKGEIL